MPQSIDTTLLNKNLSTTPSTNPSAMDSSLSVQEGQGFGTPRAAMQNARNIKKKVKVKDALKLAKQQTDTSLGGGGMASIKSSLSTMKSFFQGDFLHLTPEKTAHLLEASWKALIKTVGISSIYIVYHGFMRYVWRSEKFSDYGVFLGKFIGKGPGERAEQIIVLASVVNVTMNLVIITLVLYTIFFGLCQVTPYDLVNKYLISFIIPTCNLLN